MKSVFDNVASKHIVMNDIDANYCIRNFPSRYGFDPPPAGASDRSPSRFGATRAASSRRWSAAGRC